MDRRHFLALLSSAIVAPLAPQVVENAVERLAEWPGGEGGHVISYMVSAIPKEDLNAFRDNLARELIDGAKRALPAGTRFEIRAALPWDYGRVHGMAWYTSPAMQVEEDWVELIERAPHYELLTDRGYFLVARQTA